VIRYNRAARFCLNQPTVITRGTLAFTIQGMRLHSPATGFTTGGKPVPHARLKRPCGGSSPMIAATVVG
jgi:hypothetical protein